MRASSTPALSHAALDHLTKGWTRIDDVIIAISPGARAPRGLAVIQSILSYVGQPVRVWLSGRWTTKPGWSGLRRLDMPGIGRRWASLCETPDLDLPLRFPVRSNAVFLAGLELSVMHLGLSALSYLVRWGLVRSLAPIAGSLRMAADAISHFGTDRGGMTVEARGIDQNGRPVRARWSLWPMPTLAPTRRSLPQPL